MDFCRSNIGGFAVTNSSKIIAKLWDRPDGTVCLLGKEQGVWFVRLQRQGEILEEIAVSSAREGMETGEQWAGSERRRPDTVSSD